MLQRPIIMIQIMIEGTNAHTYTRVRELVKFAVMDCNGGDDTCFCVSMGTNRTDDYVLALKFSPDGLLVEVADKSLAPLLPGHTPGRLHSYLC